MSIFTHFLRVCFLGLLLSSSYAVAAGDIVVIVNKSNLQNVDIDFVTKAYLGKVKSWPDGTPILIYDQEASNPIHSRFYSTVLGKSPALVKVLWAQNIFTGKLLPPKVINPDSEMRRLVSLNKNAIGYINAANLDESVRLIGP